MDHGLPGPVCLVNVITVLFDLPVQGHEPLVVPPGDTALVSGGRSEIKHVPHEAAPDPRTVHENSRHVLVIERLVIFGVVLDLRIPGMVGQNAFRSVLGDGKTAVRMRRVVPVQPGFVLLHAAAVPAEVMVVCLHVRDAVQAAVLRSIGNMGQGGQAGRIQGFDQLFQVPVILHQLIGQIAAQRDFIGKSPEADAGMMGVLNDQFPHLRAAVFMRRGIFVHNGDKGYFRPDNKAQLVTGVVEILGMLVVSQADGVGAEFLDQPGVLPVLLPGEGVSFVQPVLMAADTAQRQGLPVQEEAAVRRAGKGADAGPQGYLVHDFVPADQLRQNRVECRGVRTPQPGIRHGQAQRRMSGRAQPAGSLPAVRIQHGPQYRIVIFRAGDPRLQVKNSAVLFRTRVHCDSGSAVIIQIKVNRRHADQPDAPVQSSVEGKVRVLGINMAPVFIADIYGQQVFPGPAQVRDLRAESGEASLMLRGFPAVDIDNGLQARRGNLHVHPSAGKGLFRRNEGTEVPAAFPGIMLRRGSLQVSAGPVFRRDGDIVTVMPVHRVPGVGQGDRDAFFRNPGGIRAAAREQPVIFQLGNLTHFSCLLQRFGYQNRSRSPCSLRMASIKK